MHHRDAICRKVHIEFESVSAGRQPEVEGGAGIFGAQRAPTPVREDLRAAAVKERHK
jgi:hypothetical protein